MGYIIIRPESHEEWLKARSEGIGSSDAGTVMGASPFSTPLKLWRQKKGIDPPVKETHAMKIGHYLELAISEWFASETGATIDYNSEGDWMAADEERPWRRVSPDRLYWPKGVEHLSANWHLLEIKSTSKPVDNDEIPMYWFCQVQYQMHVLGLKKAVIAYITSFPRLSMNYVEVEYNRTFAEMMVEEIDRFWNVNICQDIEPDPKDGDDVTLKWPKSEPDTSVQATDEQVALCKAHVRIKKEIKEMELQMRQIESEIKTALGKNEKMTAVNEKGKEVVIASFASVKENVFDDRMFREDFPEIYAKYVTEKLDKTRLIEENRAETEPYMSSGQGARRFCIRAAAENLH